MVAAVPDGTPAGAPPQTTVTVGATGSDESDDPVQDTETASTPEAPPPTPAKAKPAKTAKPEEPHFDGYGPQWTHAQMDDVLAYESNKNSWDNGSIRKSRGETYYGTLLVAHRCDRRDGCRDKNSGWKAIGWMIQN